MSRDSLAEVIPPATDVLVLVDETQAKDSLQARVDVTTAPLNKDEPLVTRKVHTLKLCINLTDNPKLMYRNSGVTIVCTDRPGHFW